MKMVAIISLRLMSIKVKSIRLISLLFAQLVSWMYIDFSSCKSLVFIRSGKSIVMRVCLVGEIYHILVNYGTKRKINIF